jgi:hypothetical protein
VIQELLVASHGTLLVPLALLVALTVLAKGMFSLHRSKSQNRKDFLELWRGEHPDDLWLEVAGRYSKWTIIVARSDGAMRGVRRHNIGNGYAGAAGSAITQVSDPACSNLLL